MSIVLDASAVLALLNDEPGATRVAEVLGESMISSVNFTEVGTRLVDLGEAPADAIEAVKLLGMTIVDFDADLSQRAIALRPGTRGAGLSVGDRACLALAIRENARAITADRVWNSLEVECEVEVIR